MEYNIKVSTTVTPKYISTPPIIEVKWDNSVYSVIPLLAPTTILFSHAACAGTHRFELVFRNKSYADGEATAMQVTVERLRVQHLSEDFKTHSYYCPEYPEPWITEQRAAGHNWPLVIHANTLGWNGTWGIELELPVYRWAHKTLGYGWYLENA